MDSTEGLFNSLVVELKRGTTVLLVLSQLYSREYGYSLVEKLEEKKLPIEANTLYPLLRRLEKQELLISEWDTSGTRPRKYYIISEKGKEVYERLKKEWKELSSLLNIILEEDEDESD